MDLQGINIDVLSVVNASYSYTNHLKMYYIFLHNYQNNTRAISNLRINLIKDSCNEPILIQSFKSSNDKILQALEVLTISQLNIN